MAKNQFDEGTAQTKWAYFRFAIVGPLLTSPPSKKELSKALQALADKTWEHPITGRPTRFSFSTIERWFYQARNSNNPVNQLRSKVRSDSNQPRSMSSKLTTHSVFSRECYFS